MLLSSIKNCAVVAVVFFSLVSNGLAGKRDVIDIENHLCSVESSKGYYSPFELYFKKSGKKLPHFQLFWKLSGDRLFLTKIRNDNGDQVSIKSYFPNQIKNGKVLANWFSGMLLVEKAKYSNPGKSAMVEHIKSYVFLKFRNGKLLYRKSYTPAAFYEKMADFRFREKTSSPIRKGPFYEFHNYSKAVKK